MWPRLSVRKPGKVREVFASLFFVISPGLFFQVLIRKRVLPIDLAHKVRRKCLQACQKGIKKEEHKLLSQKVSLVFRL